MNSEQNILNLDITDGCAAIVITVGVLVRVTLLFAWPRLCQNQGFRSYK